MHAPAALTVQPRTVHGHAVLIRIHMITTMIRFPCELIVSCAACTFLCPRPCPLTVSFQCACGQGQYSVPCGAESKVIAPRCNNPCPVPGLCRHAQQSGT
eukprot:scaffold97825_cov21-Tisochrysis_lutea.AAC.1